MMVFSLVHILLNFLSVRVAQVLWIVMIVMYWSHRSRDTVKFTRKDSIFLCYSLHCILSSHNQHILHLKLSYSNYLQLIFLHAYRMTSNVPAEVYFFVINYLQEEMLYSCMLRTTRMYKLSSIFLGASILREG